MLAYYLKLVNIVFDGLAFFVGALFCFEFDIWMGACLRKINLKYTATRTMCQLHCKNIKYVCRQFVNLCYGVKWKKTDINLYDQYEKIEK